MKSLLVGLALALCSTLSLANEFDVLPDEVWVYPTLISQVELFEDTQTKNHYLNAKLLIDDERTKRVVDLVQKQYPQHKMRVYRVDFVEGVVSLPELKDVALDYTPTMGGGWNVGASFVMIPDRLLGAVKASFNLGSPLVVTMSHYKVKMTQSEVIRVSCAGEEGQESGVGWMFDRLKAVEKVINAQHPRIVSQNAPSFRSFSRSA